MKSPLAELVLLSRSLLKSFLPPPCPEVLIFFPICLLCFRDLPTVDAVVGRDFVCSGLASGLCLAGSCRTQGAGGEGQRLPAPPQTVKCEHLKLCFSWLAAVLSVL